MAFRNFFNGIRVSLPCKVMFPAGIFFAASCAFWALAHLSSFLPLEANFQSRQKKVEKARFNILILW